MLFAGRHAVRLCFLPPVVLANRLPRCSRISCAVETESTSVRMSQSFDQTSLTEYSTRLDSELITSIARGWEEGLTLLNAVERLQLLARAGVTDALAALLAECAELEARLATLTLESVATAAKLQTEEREREEQRENYKMLARLEEVQGALASASEKEQKKDAALAGARRFLRGPACATAVRFHVRASTRFGEEMRLSGNVSSLGCWEPKASIPMHFTADDMWVADTVLPGGSVVEYKYLIVNQNGEIMRWQAGADAALAVFRDEAELAVHDDWTGDPTLCSVQANGKIEGRQARLVLLLADSALRFKLF